jgi:hypothetical protein
VRGLPSGKISADYFAMFYDRIQQLLGADVQRPAFVGILANGPCGDVNNIGGGTPGVKCAPGERMRAVAGAGAARTRWLRKVARYQPRGAGGLAQDCRQAHGAVSISETLTIGRFEEEARQ